MNKLAKESGVENHYLLRGTQLRKQMATRCTEFNLDPVQTTKAADYLGHAVDIHKKVYQQRVKSDILNMSTLLKRAQNIDESQTNTTVSTYMDTTNTVEYKSSLNAGK